MITTILRTISDGPQRVLLPQEKARRDYSFFWIWLALKKKSFHETWYQGVICYKFICCLVKLSLKCRFVEVKVHPTAEASRKGHQPVRRSSQRRLKEWAAALSHS